MKGELRFDAEIADSGCLKAAEQLLASVSGLLS